MKTLPEAWKWYEVTKEDLQRMRRLGEKYWNDPSMENASLWQDERFRMLEKEEIVAGTEVSLGHIDDLAVVVLFSVFESVVRDILIGLIRPEANNIIHPILKEAASDVLRGVEEGSFYRRVLEPLKKQHPRLADIITQIDQVRDYRNWVAHGRREVPTNNVTPGQAYERLTEFLAALGQRDEDNLNQSE
jgi:hypothetical protein